MDFGKTTDHGSEPWGHITKLSASRMCDLTTVGMITARNHVDYGCVLARSLVLFFNQNLSPITVIIGCKMIGIIRLVQSSEARVSQDPINLVMGIRRDVLSIHLRTQKHFTRRESIQVGNLCINSWNSYRAMPKQVRDRLRRHSRIQ